MALETTKENVMSAVSTMGYEVFRNGQFHFNSSETPDMLINDDGSIHCWTDSPFKGKNHGDLIDFVLVADSTINNFFEAKKKAYELINMPLPSIDSYKDNGYIVSSSEKKSGFITNDFISIFIQERKENFTRYMELLKQALPSCDFKTQKLLAERFEIGYSKQADRLIMPMRDENDNCVTLWKYNKNPKIYTNDEGKEIKPSKVTFTKGRERRVPFNLKNLIKYREDKSKWIVLCAGEKDTLNALGNGYRAFTLGAENVLVPDLYLPLLKDLKIIIAYDYDKAGRTGAERIYEQLKDTASELIKLDWEKETKRHKIKLFNGFDFTDYLVGKKK